MSKATHDPEFAPDPAYDAILRPRPPMLTDEHKGLLIAVGMLIALISIIAGLVMYLAWLHHQTERAAIEAGLVQGEIPGRSGIYWVEPVGGRKPKP